MRLIERMPRSAAWLASGAIHGLMASLFLALGHNLVGRFVADAALAERAPEIGAESVPAGEIARSRAVRVPAAITLRVSRHDTPEPVKPDPRPVDAVPPGAPPATEPVSSTAPTAAPDKDAAPEPEVANTDFPGDTFLAVNERDSINPLPFPFLRVMMPEPMSAWVLVNVYITREGVVKAHEVLSGAGDWRFASLLECFF